MGLNLLYSIWGMAFIFVNSIFFVVFGEVELDVFFSGTIMQNSLSCVVYTGGKSIQTELIKSYETKSGKTICGPGVRDTISIAKIIIIVKNMINKKVV